MICSQVISMWIKHKTCKHTHLPMGPGGEICCGRLTGVELLAPGCFCSLSGVFLSCGVPLVLVILSWSASSPFSTAEAVLFCNSCNSSSSPSPDTPEDEGLDVCLFPSSSLVLLGVTKSGLLLFKFISFAAFNTASLSITSDAISYPRRPCARAGQIERVRSRRLKY